MEEGDERSNVLNPEKASLSLPTVSKCVEVKNGAWSSVALEGTYLLLLALDTVWHSIW